MFTREKSEMKRVPMMPVRDMVIFPQMMQPFIVGTGPWRTAGYFADHDVEA